MHQRVDRRHLRFALWVTVLALPFLVLDNIKRHDANAEQVPSGTRLGGLVNDAVEAHEAHAAAMVQREQVLARPGGDRCRGRPQRRPPCRRPRRPPSPHPRPRHRRRPPRRRRPRRRHRRRPRRPHRLRRRRRRPPNTEQGVATWYRQPAQYPPDGCAHQTLPFGTVVTVTNHNTGGTTFCIVSDRGPFGAGRIIDLDDDVVRAAGAAGRRRHPGHHHLVASQTW